MQRILINPAQKVQTQRKNIDATHSNKPNAKKKQ